MAKTDLKLISKDTQTGKNITTTIPYVNAGASSATLKQYAQMLNNLTDNNYVESDRTQTINVDTEEVPGQTPEKPVPTITLTPSTLTKSQVNSGNGGFTVSWTGDYNGRPYVLCGKIPSSNITPAQDQAVTFKCSIEFPSNESPGQGIIFAESIGDATFPATIRAVAAIPETDNYASATADIVITN